MNNISKLIELSESITYYLDTELEKKGIKVFKSIDDVEKLNLINNETVNTCLCQYILDELSMIQGKRIEIRKSNDYIGDAATAKVVKIGKYPMFVYDKNLNLIRIEYGRKHTVKNLTIGLIKVVEENMAKLNKDVKTKKLMLEV